MDRWPATPALVKLRVSGRDIGESDVETDDDISG
jgi:hypothetical protein